MTRAGASAALTLLGILAVEAVIDAVEALTEVPPAAWLLLLGALL